MLLMRETIDGIDVAARFAALGESAAPDVLPDVAIVTERMRLRAYTDADVDAHRAIFDHELARRWSVAPQPYTRDHALRWCTRTAPDLRTSGNGICWAVDDLATGRLVGVTGFHRIDWRERTADVSATEAAWALGRGYASEALRAMSHWLLAGHGFHRIQITAAVGNWPSRRVAEACGFVCEGVLRNAGSGPAGRTDLVMYGLVPADLAALPRPRYSAREPGSAARTADQSVSS